MSKKPKQTKASLPKNYHSITTSSYQPNKPVHLESDERKPKKKRRKRTVLFKMLLLITLIVFALFMTIVVWDLRNFQNVSKKLFSTDNVWEVLQTKELDSTPDGRVNILIVGYSVDDPNHGGANLTDSVLIVSLDKVNHTGYMLSVPRDLYVEIPNYGYAKINEAFPAGENQNFRAAGYPRGGMGLLQKVVGDTFDIDLHYFALINYTSVKEVVDALGGIDVAINSPDERGIYDPNFPLAQGGPLKLTNGTHHVDGQTALRLTRARGSTYGSYGFPLSDFNRTKNQQQVFTAIKNRLNWSLVLDPRTNGQIFEAAGNNIKTDANIHEAIPLYRLFVSIPNGNLKPISLRELNGINLLTEYTTPLGQSALIPTAGIDDYSQIKAHIEKLSR